MYTLQRRYHADWRHALRAILVLLDLMPAPKRGAQNFWYYYFYFKSFHNPDRALTAVFGAVALGFVVLIMLTLQGCAGVPRETMPLWAQQVQAEANQRVVVSRRAMYALYVPHKFGRGEHYVQNTLQYTTLSQVTPVAPGQQEWGNCVKHAVTTKAICAERGHQCYLMRCTNKPHMVAFSGSIVFDSSFPEPITLAESDCRP